MLIYKGKSTLELRTEEALKLSALLIKVCL